MNPNRKTLFGYRDLLKELVSRDLKLKYRRSFLGYVWSVLNPLMIMVIMYIVFSNIFRWNIPYYPVYLISGQMMFNFFSASTTQSIYSITDNASLLKKTYVPKYIFTLSKVTSGMLDFLFSLGAMFLVIIFTKTPFHWSMLAIPLVAVQLYLFCLGVGLFMSAANVFFRDIQYIYSALLTAWMYATPIFYPFELLPDRLKVIIKLINPLYSYVTQFRDVIISGHLPGYRLLLMGIGFSALALAVGSFTFSRTQDKFILYI